MSEEDVERMETVEDDEDDASDGVLEVPPFIPSPKREDYPIIETTTTVHVQPTAEVTFSNLDKFHYLVSLNTYRSNYNGGRESCLSLKEAFVNWATTDIRSNHTRDDAVGISGKFRLEFTPEGRSRIMFVPSTTSCLSEQHLKQPVVFNEVTEKRLELPLYLRDCTQLPESEGGRPPVLNQQCFNCGSYHHRVNQCKRPQRPRNFDRGRGRGRHDLRSREETKRPSLQSSGNGTGAPKRLRTYKGAVESATETSAKLRENAIPAVKIELDSDSDIGDGLEEGEVVEQQCGWQSLPVRPPPPPPISLPAPTTPQPRHSDPTPSFRIPPPPPITIPSKIVVPKEHEEGEIEEGEIIEKSATPSVVFSTPQPIPAIAPIPRPLLATGPVQTPPGGESVVRGVPPAYHIPPPPPPPPLPTQKEEPFFVRHSTRQPSMISVDVPQYVDPTYLYQAATEDTYYLQAATPAAGFPPPAVYENVSQRSHFSYAPAKHSSHIIQAPSPPTTASTDIVMVDNQGKVIIIKQPQHPSGNDMYHI